MHGWVPKVSYINRENEIMPISPTSNNFTLKKNPVSCLLLPSYDFLLKSILSRGDLRDPATPSCAAAADGTQRG